MTCEYSTINFWDALYTCARAYPGGVEALANRLKVAPSTLYNKLRPGIKTHEPTGHEIYQIIEWCQDAAVPEADLVLDAWDWHFGRVGYAVPKTVLRDDVLANQLLRVLRANGDVATKIEQALMNDNRVDRREKDAVEKCVQESIEALAQLLEMIKAKHRTDYPEQRAGTV